MNTVIQLILPMVVALLVGLIILPRILKLSLRIGFTDKPGGRKVHRKPIPVIGGIGIFLSVLGAVAASAELRHFLATHVALMLSGIVLTLVGVVDDKFSLPAKLRMLVQLGCAYGIAYSGIRIETLHGIAGIYGIPLVAQYALTIIVITGITNAFNLIDGIDGLAGMLAFANVLVFASLAIVLKQYDVVLLLAAIAGGIIAFLKYNLYPARIFMGDAGSLLLGFVMSVVGIRLTSLTGPSYFPEQMPVIVVTACFIIPVVDTLRVFVQRIRSGKSPFSADKTHLHHKLIRHFLVHGSAGRKLLTLHLSVLGLSIVITPWVGILSVIGLQAGLVVMYTLFLNFSHNYSRWYRFIKRYENAG